MAPRVRRELKVAHLWLTAEDGELTVFPLLDRGYGFGAMPPSKLGAKADSARIVSLLPALAEGKARWVLVAPIGSLVHVNGWPLRTGLRVLLDRDEIEVVGVGTFFFSTESLARVESLPARGRVVHCARCKLVIEQGSPAVRCPACQVWHHQCAEYQCWTYSESCALCSQRTQLDATYRWTPAEVWA